MTLLLVILLTVLWGAVFVPAILRARQETSPIVTVGSFRKGMRALGARSSYRSASRVHAQGAPRGRWIVMPVKPETKAEVRRRTLVRRRRIFAGLLLTAAATLLIGFAPGMRDLLRIHIAVDLALGVYVFFLVQAKQRRVFESEEHAQAPIEEIEEPLARVGQLS